MGIIGSFTPLMDLWLCWMGSLSSESCLHTVERISTTFLCSTVLRGMLYSFNLFTHMLLKESIYFELYTVHKSTSYTIKTLQMLLPIILKF